MKRLAVVLLRRMHIDAEVKENLQRSVPVWIASLITGAVAVGYAKLFSEAEAAGKRLFLYQPLWLFAITPVCFAMAWYCVYRFAPLARGSGIPQISAALELAETPYEYAIQKLLNLRVLLTKIVSSTILVFGGGAIGREGPTIQISATIFRLVGLWTPVSWPAYSERVLILTGSAAGLAAAFNTPLGGIVFAIEELSRLHFNAFRTTLLASVIVAGLTAQTLLGPYLFLGYVRVGGTGIILTLIVIGAAVTSGIVGGFFSRIIFSAVQAVRKVQRAQYQLLLALLLGLMLALIAYFHSFKILGSGKENLSALLLGANADNSLDGALMRIIGPLITFVSGGAGGIFAPALSAGAALGSVFSGFFALTTEQINVVILSGMVGFLTALTRSPFTSTVLVLEMTDRHSVIFYLMLAGLASYAGAWLVNRQSLYDKLKALYLRDAIPK